MGEVFPTASVVITTYNRAHLLERSLQCYKDQKYDNERVEYIIIDDWSTDYTARLCAEWAPRLNIIYMRPLWKEPGKVRDGAAIINLGLRAARGEYIAITHPEIMVGRKTLCQGVKRIQMAPIPSLTAYHARAYWLLSSQQEQIDTVNWHEEGPLAVRNLPNFYEDSRNAGGQEKYWHENIEKPQDWGSQQFTLMQREGWLHMGGLAEYETWGSVDVDFFDRRRILGIKDVSNIDLDSMMVHQNHDKPEEGAQVRDMDKCMAALKRYRHAHEARRNLWSW